MSALLTAPVPWGFITTALRPFDVGQGTLGRQCFPFPFFFLFYFILFILFLFLSSSSSLSFLFGPLVCRFRLLFPRHDSFNGSRSKLAIVLWGTTLLSYDKNRTGFNYILSVDCSPPLQGTHRY